METAVGLGVRGLQDGGFTRIGQWQADPSVPDTLILDGQAPVAPGVYAFALKTQVMYVGSAQRGLRSRLRRYAISRTMRTSARVRSLVLEAMASGNGVDVLVACPPPLSWSGLPVDAIAGLEEGLIRSFRPLWNIRGNTSLRDLSASELAAGPAGL